jgi:hypothetical protein
MGAMIGRGMTMSDQLARHAWTIPDTVALRFEGSGRSYGQLDERVTRNALRDRGARSDDRVAVAGLNCLELVESYLAAVRLGAIAVPINFRLVADEVGYALSDNGTVAVVVDAPLADTVAKAREQVPSVETALVIGGGDAGRSSEDLREHLLRGGGERARGSSRRRRGGADRGAAPEVGRGAAGGRDGSAHWRGGRRPRRPFARPPRPHRLSAAEAVPRCGGPTPRHHWTGWRQQRNGGSHAAEWANVCRAITRSAEAPVALAQPGLGALPDLGVVEPAVGRDPDLVDHPVPDLADLVALEDEHAWRAAFPAEGHSRTLVVVEGHRLRAQLIAPSTSRWPRRWSTTTRRGPYRRRRSLRS